MNYTRTRFLIGSFLAFLAWLVMLLMGGKGAAADVWASHFLSAAGKPALESFANLVGHLGDWPTLAIAAVLGTILTAIHRRRRAALLLILIVTGRLVTEVQKALIGRVPPNAPEYFEVHRAGSFPSVSAANAMITFLAIALLLPSREWKHAVYITVALVLSFLAGWSQAAVGHSWPSDVVGGWAFGLFWVMVVLRLATDRPGD